ncbi:hypothetical protein ACOME3_008693 [Neoechinorhynchus agilis]
MNQYCASIYVLWVYIIFIGTNGSNLSKEQQSFMIPSFHNVALNKPIKASSTCGLHGPVEMCSSTRCDICDSTIDQLSHPPKYLVDFSHHENTCWRSDFLNTNMTAVNFHLSLEKLYELSYMSIQMCENRLAQLNMIQIEISSDFGHKWRSLPFIYSADCMFVDIAQKKCVEWIKRPMFSRISVSFISDLKKVLEATDLRINVYANISNNSTNDYISLSDLSLGGRCKCNGHASICTEDRQGKMICLCGHHTAGRDCERCDPMYQDAPWSLASTTEPKISCRPCQCNNHAVRCEFNVSKYINTGNRTGGICQNCSDYTDGDHCDTCQRGYKRDYGRKITDQSPCIPCSCHKIGAKNDICHPLTGQCMCKFGVVGLKCDRCAKGFYQTRSQHQPCRNYAFNKTHHIYSIRPKTQTLDHSSITRHFRRKHTQCERICLSSSGFTQAQYCKAKFGTLLS